jgi:hypothetical protein
LLSRLAAGDLIRLPPWSRHIQLIAVGNETGSVPSPTFRVLLRYGWIERASGPGDQVPTYRLSDAGRRLLSATEHGAAEVPGEVARRTCLTE